MPVRVDLRVLGGNGEIHRAETITVNMHGALLETSSDFLKPNDEIEIHVHLTTRTAIASVVYVVDHHAGIELHEPNNIWGVVAPPDDWDAYMESQR